MGARVFSTPEPNDLDQEVLDLIDQLRQDLRHRVAEPRRWIGSLRRMTFVRAVQGSNSIEGYDASLDDVAAAVDGEPTLEASAETQLALAGYRDAMTYVLQVGQDDGATIDEGLLKALHFMMLRHDLSKSPGRWRPGYIAIRNDGTGQLVYEGPEAERVSGLIRAMLDELELNDAPVLILAAMAHLNLVMIHPFRDGNGRMARALQTLVLAKEQTFAPVFSSIEEYLGRNTQAYYDVLGEVGQGAWCPERDARPWVRFCLVAHYRQARTHLRRIEEIENLWTECLSLTEQHGLPERAAGGLADAAMGFRLRNSTYRTLVEVTAGEEISELTSSRDLKAMVDATLLQPIGEKRGRHYVADLALKELRGRIRSTRTPRDDHDPFTLAVRRRQLTLTD